MPLIVVATSAAVPREAKAALAAQIVAVFSEQLRTTAAHNHVRISDSEFIAFGGDPEAPAAVVQVKAAQGAISKEARSAIAAALSAALTSAIQGLAPECVYATFEETPVENIAVGASVMRFTTIKTAKSAANIEDASP